MSNTTTGSDDTYIDLTFQPNDKQPEEHIFRPMTNGTGAVCSCGKEFATTSEQQQHIDWHIRKQAPTPNKLKALETNDE